MSDYLLRTITFMGEAVSVEYFDPRQDVKANGMVLNHGLLVPVDGPMVELAGPLAQACQLFLQQALAVFQGSEVTRTAYEQFAREDDDAPSPYDNPDER